MKRKIILWICLFLFEALLTVSYYPKKQQDIQKVREEIQDTTLKLNDLNYQIKHMEELEIRIQEKQTQTQQTGAREQLINFLKKIERYPFQEIHYKKQKEVLEGNHILENKYRMSAVGHYNDFLNLIEYIEQNYTHLYIQNLHLEDSVQDLNDPTHLTYATLYGNKLKNVYLMHLDWVVEYETL